MILITATIVKLLLLFLALAGAFLLFRGTRNKMQFAIFATLTILFAFVASIIASKLPPLTDEVTLTALDEKCEGAGAEDICLMGYTIDGQSYTSGKSLQIVKGKWFWGGENYIWRPEANPCQPEGITPSITVKIPVGWSRSLDFGGSYWHGMVEISSGDETWVVDTFTEAEDGGTISIYLNSSAKLELILNQIRYLTVYAILLLTWFFIAKFIIQFFAHQPEQYRSWVEKNGGKLCYAAIALLSFLCMFHHADGDALYLDELIQIGMSKEGLQKSVEYCLEMFNGVPPLNTILPCLWWKIAPYGEQWLVLPSIALTAISVYIIGLTGEQIGGEQSCGVLASCMMAFSPSVWGFSAFEVRGYSSYLFFSVLSFYYYAKKMERDNKWQILYSISLLGLAMSHYFGMILCGTFFLADFYLWISKKVSYKVYAAYILPGGSSLLWLALVYQTILQKGGLGNGFVWYPIPSLHNLGDLLYWLSGRNVVIFALLLIGFANVIAQNTKKNSNLTEKDKNRKYLLTLSAIQLIGIAGAVYFYGHYINPERTLWEYRYFLGLIPSVVLLSALAVKCLISTGDQNQTLRMRTAVIAVCIVVFSHCIMKNPPYGSESSYRNAADWLYTQIDDVFSDDTILITSAGGLELEGWKEYYITQQGRRDDLPLQYHREVTKSDVLSHNKVYLYRSLDDIDERIQSVLNENYSLIGDFADIQIKVYVRTQ